jgi:arsenate reductase
MERVTIYHNPACGKSRGALEILRQRGIAHDVVEYLQAPPDRAALGRILDLLPGAPAQLVRKDKRFKELGLDERAYTTREQVIELLLAHPELMERPVVIRGRSAVIARPSERVAEILDQPGGDR